MARRATRTQRNFLWARGSGRCCRCGREVGHDFHADHKTIPWAVGRKTDIQDMQILCKRCNAQKGKAMLRSHQLAALEIADDPALGKSCKKILAYVTPGGGKSMLPVILADRLIKRNVIDRVCWVTPRDNLRYQAEEAFSDKGCVYKKIYGEHGLEIRAAGNDSNLTKGLVGYATTYQAIVKDGAELHPREFAKHRYMLVLDEGQHVCEGKTWHSSIQPLVDRCALLVIMSGTLSRPDRTEKIAFVDYEYRDGVFSPILRNTESLRYIEYWRTDALRERAILPIYFERVDGAARWMDKNGNERQVSSLAGLGEDTFPALFTALSEGYAIELLDAMLDHWCAYKKHNSRSKYLVVAPDIATAKIYLKHCRKRGLNKVEIATSDESEEAKENIRRFKGKAPEVDGLVTVGMAYEGMNVKPISHIACLTRYRSAEWIEQMLARAVRVDDKAGKWEEQAAHVWAPDDDKFTAAIARIQAEQAPFVTVKKEKSPGGAGPEPTIVVPLHAEATDTRAVDMQTGEVINAEKYRELSDLAVEYNLGHINKVVLGRFAEAWAARSRSACHQQRQTDERTITPSEREKRLKDVIKKRIAVWCNGSSEEIHRINTLIMRAFNWKNREDMTETELRAVISYLDNKLGPVPFDETA